MGRWATKVFHYAQSRAPCTAEAPEILSRDSLLPLAFHSCKYRTATIYYQSGGGVGLFYVCSWLGPWLATCSRHDNFLRRECRPPAHSRQRAPGLGAEIGSH